MANIEEFSAHSGDTEHLSLSEDEEIEEAQIGYIEAIKPTKYMNLALMKEAHHLEESDLVMRWTAWFWTASTCFQCFFSALGVRPYWVRIGRHTAKHTAYIVVICMSASMRRSPTL